MISLTHTVSECLQDVYSSQFQIGGCWSPWASGWATSLGWGWVWRESGPANFHPHLPVSHIWGFSTSFGTRHCFPVVFSWVVQSTFRMWRGRQSTAVWNCRQSFYMRHKHINNNCQFVGWFSQIFKHAHIRCSEQLWVFRSRSTGRHKCSSG